MSIHDPLNLRRGGINRCVRIIIYHFPQEDKQLRSPGQAEPNAMAGPVLLRPNSSYHLSGFSVIYEDAIVRCHDDKLPSQCYCDGLVREEEGLSKGCPLSTTALRQK